MLVNTLHEKIQHEAIHLHDIPTPPFLKQDVMRPESDRWCQFHRVKGHNAKDYYKLKKDINRLIEEGHLQKYIEEGSSKELGMITSHERDYTGIPKPRKGKELSKEKGDKVVCYCSILLQENLMGSERLLHRKKICLPNTNYV